MGAWRPPVPNTSLKSPSASVLSCASFTFGHRDGPLKHGPWRYGSRRYGYGWTMFDEYAIYLVFERSLYNLPAMESHRHFLSDIIPGSHCPPDRRLRMHPRDQRLQRISSGKRIKLTARRR